MKVDLSFPSTPNVSAEAQDLITKVIFENFQISLYFFYLILDLTTFFCAASC